MISIPEGTSGVPSVAGPAPTAVYVHFPFCTHRCHYCDFSVARSAEPPVAEWLDCVSAELDWWFDTAGWASPVRLDTLFVGGGTPSLLGPEGMRELGRRLRGRLTLDERIEWTAEANPISFSEDLGSAWREAGVNRLSLGVQSLDDGVLRWLGRLHDADAAARAVEAARAAGFASVNLDLMFGLPAGVRRDLAAELGRVTDLGVEHVSAYGLTIEARTPLAQWVELGRVKPASGAAYAAEYREVAGRLAGDGYEHYEVSSFARPGHQCRHNWYYWNRAPYLGLGPSAHGFLPPNRIWNVFRWVAYRDVVRAGAGPVEGSERLGAREVELERLWLGLRTDRGLPATDPAWGDRAKMAGWLQAGWLRREDDRVVASVEGWLRMDAMVSELWNGEASD